MISETIPEAITKIEKHMRIDTQRFGVRYATLDGQLFEPLQENINAIEQILKPVGITPFFELNKQPLSSPHRLKLALFKIKKVRQRFWLNWLLLGITLVSTTFAGAFWAEADFISNPWDILKGLPFSLSLIIILGAHELGHYLTCRKYGIPATPPFFIPFLPPFGTMGAVIRMGLINNRRSLIRIGAAGPIAGFIIAVAILIIGMVSAEVVPIDSYIAQLKPNDSVFLFGEPLIYKFFHYIVLSFKGKAFLPDTSLMLKMNPLIIAAWIGFLVTSLNLLPLSQFDGGHIAYGIFGKKRIFLMIPVYALMLLAAILLKAWVWLVWGAMSLIFGFRHPPASDEITPLTRLDFVIAVIALIILILSVSPMPLDVVPAKVAIQRTLLH